MFRSKGGKPFFQEAAVERSVVGDDEHDLLQQIVDGLIVDPLTGDHLIGNAGDVRDLRRDRAAGIFEPLPGAKDFVDPSGQTIIFEQANVKLDDLVVVGVGGGASYPGCAEKPVAGG